MTCRLVVPPAGQCPPAVAGDPSSPPPPPPRQTSLATGQGQFQNPSNREAQSLGIKSAVRVSVKLIPMRRLRSVATISTFCIKLGHNKILF
jgi:hypothetical protein